MSTAVRGYLASPKTIARPTSKSAKCSFSCLTFPSGTYSKRSRVVNGRRPFAKDCSIMNYDYDSEAEWEEEDPDGASLIRSFRAHLYMIYVCM